MGHIVDIFAWTWNILGGCTENTSKQQKNGCFSEELLSKNDFEGVLVTFCSSGKWGYLWQNYKKKKFKKVLSSAASISHYSEP